MAPTAATEAVPASMLCVSGPEREPERSAADIGRSVDSGTGLMFTILGSEQTPLPTTESEEAGRAAAPLFPDGDSTSRPQVT